VSTVRIAHAEPRPGRLANGSFDTRGHLVVLADDAGRRAVPIWLRGEPGSGELAHLLGADPYPAPGSVPQELTTRLLHAARAAVTAVDLDLTEPAAAELTPELTVARIDLSGPAGPRQVTASLGLGLALAAAAAAPVRVADTVLDRLATPVPGDDLLTPFLDRVPPLARARPGGGLPGWPIATLPARRPRYEPRNLDFADGLDRWDLEGEADAEADGSSAVLSSTTPGPAALLQAIFADDYRGATVTFTGEIHADPGIFATAGLRLQVIRQWWRIGQASEDYGLTIADRHPWTRHEVTAPIPADADLIRFGIVLTGPSRIALRHPELTATR
jgi:hypothetical protein